MKKHSIVSPIASAALVIALFIGYAIYFIFFDFSWILTIFVSVVFLSSISIVLYVLLQRIKEIRNGEEDDLSKY